MLNIQKKKNDEFTKKASGDDENKQKISEMYKDAWKISSNMKDKNTKPGNIFKNLKNTDENNIYKDNLEENYFESKAISSRVLKQLKLMKKASQENLFLHLEPVTLKLYESVMKKVIREFIQLNDMKDIVERSMDVIDALNIKHNFRNSRRFKTFVSSLNHYLRFFKNTKEKQHAIINYKNHLF